MHHRRRMVAFDSVYRVKLSILPVPLGTPAGSSSGWHTLVLNLHSTRQAHNVRPEWGARVRDGDDSKGFDDLMGLVSLRNQLSKSTSPVQTTKFLITKPPRDESGLVGENPSIKWTEDPVEHSQIVCK
jgi:hypothetical protein